MEEKKILQSWKEIASYLGRAERTCRRWEKEFGLPVHRMDGSARTSVFAYKGELDRWLDRLLHEKKISPKKSFLFSKKKLGIILGISILFVSFLTVVTWKIFSPKPGVSSSSVKPSLAILHFSNNTGDESLDHWRSTLPDWLITDLNQSKYLRVLSGDRLLNILRKHNLIEAKSYDSKDLENVAQEGAVNHILKASFSKVGETFRIDYSLHDVNSWESVGANYVTGRGEESFPSMVDELTKKIKADLNISADKIADEFDKDVYKLNIEGSNYHRMTEFRKAIESREKAVTIDPGFSTAYRADDYARSIAVDLDGNYVVAGVDKLIDPHGGWRVQKIDQAGNNVWTYLSNPGPRWSWTSSVAVDKEGNYIIGGVVRFIGNYGWWVEKLNPSGSLLWSYTNNPTGKDDYIEAVAVDSSGNYILAGFEFSVRESNERIRVEKLSSTGSLLWSYVHNPTTGYDRANSLAVDGKGNYIVAGCDEPGDANNFRWRVEKLGPNGNLIWEYISDPSDDSSYGHDCVEVAASIAVDDDGNYVIAGNDNTPGNYQWRVEKIDADGNLIWVYTSNPSEQNEHPKAIAVDKDGSYVVAGCDKALGDLRWRIEIINKDGNLVSVYTNNPSDESDALNSIAVDIDGNYIAAGFETVLGNRRLRIEKLESFIPVEIDIKPGSYPNSIDLGSHGDVPVAIFSTEGFDATTVDPLTVTLAGASVKLKGQGTPQASAIDVNEDGLPDLVVHVDTTALESTEDDAEAELMGMTFDGLEIRGVDTVRIIDEKSEIRSIPHRI